MICTGVSDDYVLSYHSFVVKSLFIAQYLNYLNYNVPCGRQDATDIVTKITAHTLNVVTQKGLFPVPYLRSTIILGFWPQNVIYSVLFFLFNSKPDQHSGS